MLRDEHIPVLRLELPISELARLEQSAARSGTLPERRARELLIGALAVEEKRL